MAKKVERTLLEPLSEERKNEILRYAEYTPEPNGVIFYRWGTHYVLFADGRLFEAGSLYRDWLRLEAKEKQIKAWLNE